MSPARILLGVLGVGCIAAGLALGLPKLLSGEHDKFGQVPIPGKTTLDLPDDETVVVFYQESVTTPRNGIFPEPAVDYDVRPVGRGDPLPLDGDGNRQLTLYQGLSRTDIEGIEVPEAGRYMVTARSVDKPSPVEPVLFFGTSGVSFFSILVPIAGCLVGSLFLVAAFVDLPGTLGTLLRRDERGPTPPGS